jgi:hypothetical protein
MAVGFVAMATDAWSCTACGATTDLAGASVEVGLVRLAAHGSEGFHLGSEGVADEVSVILAPCPCGGRFAPGAGHGELRAAAFDTDAVREAAVRGWPVLESDPELHALREVWRPRALLLAGREDELSKEDVLRLRLEDKLSALQTEVERATAAGDLDAAETAHARYIELGTTYVRRFVRSDVPA